MSLREEIQTSYIDGNQLVAPNRCDPNTRASDNGPMFTAEFFILLKMLGQDSPSDKQDFAARIRACFLEPGLLVRAPQDRGTEGPDDFYGVLAACSYLSLPDVANEILTYGRSQWGFFNGNNPGSIYWADKKEVNWEAFIWRQPQIIALNLMAADRFSIFKPLWTLCAALVIATSCINTPISDTDARRLSFLLALGTKKSWLCRQATKLWLKRLYRDYPNGMQDVYRMYYQEGHPFGAYVPKDLYPVFDTLI